MSYKFAFARPIALAAVFATASAQAGRTVTSLDGTWRLADGTSADAIPSEFPASVAVPGLANQSQPAFKDTDRFTSRENMANLVRAGVVPEGWMTEFRKGKVDQDRNYFWYRKTFLAPKVHDVATLKIAKAQFGTAVWLNGKKIGEQAGCFTAGFFDLAGAIRWGDENTLIVRVGAHPAVLPDTYPTGSDFEKIKWTPGIYDSVSLIACDNPAIETVQVAPRIATGEIIVQTRVRNAGAATLAVPLTHKVRPWKGGPVAGESTPQSVTLPPGGSATVVTTLRIPDAHLWTPGDPFLYVVESSTGGDTVTTRFGMREFRFDAATGRAMLNNRIIFLRGSNVTLHRFFEDPDCKGLPWDEAWVRNLLVDIPRQMHWNYFRFCIGPVPDRWLDICDEAGLLIQNEFFVWTGRPEWYKGYSRTHDTPEMIRQYADWMRDNWNHPSVAVWDANNETLDKSFGDSIIPAVRPMDLSNRPWENSYNRPVDPNDPVEDHPYLMISGHRGKLTFKMSDLETMDGAPRKNSLPSATNPALVNEYGWLWLNRDGTPTRLTTNVYAQLMGTNTTARERLDMYSYLLGAKTEFWRAHRKFAGIVHFVYLTCSYPGVYTADHFADVRRLRLDPAFADYMGEAFKPLGVYVNFFQPSLAAGTNRTFKVMMVNDEDAPASGTLALTLETPRGRVVARTEMPFEIAGLGDRSLEIPLKVPDVAGAHILKAAARVGNGDPTLSRRRVTIGTAAPAAP